ncbi:cell division protein CrgA [Nocardiopsis suaedae]|uniref:Cell division protein CrgA n=1 Tax=Nocardiopsis suaedae TaxID=3018444 RepID=A0ABT4TQ70_9ACTN|nr:cell division protein CrgA [Nocardiopsis suaedae]MDA2806511.1 cell division protein CrgA [Nocardiopsis suaedae]
MPKSRNDRKNKAKKAVYTPPVEAVKPKISPRWLAPAMLTFGIVGVLWIATYYIAGVDGKIPFMAELGNWNLAIGFGGIIICVILSTRWH